MNNGNQKVGSILHQREKLLVKEKAQEPQNTEETFDKEEEQLQEETQVEGPVASQDELNSNETAVPIEATIFTDTTPVGVGLDNPYINPTLGSVKTEFMTSSNESSDASLGNPYIKLINPDKDEGPYGYTKNTELEDFVKYAAGPFYAAYLNAGRIKTEHLRNSGDIIREEAAREIVKFGKILLAVLKEEQA